MEGKFGYMVSLAGSNVVTVPIIDAIKELRGVDLNGDLVRTARALGIGFGDR
jgi:6-phosphofructokinase 1